MALAIRKATRDDLNVMVASARQLEWNPGVDDATLYAAVDADSFFVGALDGSIVTMVSAAVYKDLEVQSDASGGSTAPSTSYVHVGLFITLPEYRGRGFGTLMGHHALARVKLLRPRCIGCDAVPERVADYVTQGFVPAYSLYRYAFTVGALRGGTALKARGAPSWLRRWPPPPVLAASFRSRPCRAPRS